MKARVQTAKQLARYAAGLTFLPWRRAAGFAMGKVRIPDIPVIFYAIDCHAKQPFRRAARSNSTVIRPESASLHTRHASMRPNRTLLSYGLDGLTGPLGLKIGGRTRGQQHHLCSAYGVTHPL